ncbi:hypothetical protein [Deinococcus roseus]|uniref:Uncharacterized protein n=1 Tax=Deinococcus roseus TaxID=392414 RepID=A0ABQ2DJA1_9DEIO|nr:hypothetical protein [Deinococcus roseus]GGJ59148.1 hypothetical protein GCM10008938_51560 [Deinococcus roseus]
MNNQSDHFNRLLKRLAGHFSGRSWRGRAIDRSVEFIKFQNNQDSFRVYAGMIVPMDPESEIAQIDEYVQYVTSTSGMYDYFSEIPIIVFDYHIDDRRYPRTERQQRFSKLLGMELDCLGYSVKLGYFEDILADVNGIIYGGDFSNEVLYPIGINIDDALRRILDNNPLFVEDERSTIEFDNKNGIWIPLSNEEKARRKSL